MSRLNRAGPGWDSNWLQKSAVDRRGCCGLGQLPLPLQQSVTSLRRNIEFPSIRAASLAPKQPGRKQTGLSGAGLLSDGAVAGQGAWISWVPAPFPVRPRTLGCPAPAGDEE